MQALASSRYGETVQFIQDEQEMSIVNRYGIKYVAQIWNQILENASKQGMNMVVLATIKDTLKPKHKFFNIKQTLQSLGVTITITEMVW